MTSKCDLCRNAMFALALCFTAPRPVAFAYQRPPPVAPARRHERRCGRASDISGRCVATRADKGRRVHASRPTMRLGMSHMTLHGCAGDFYFGALFHRPPARDNAIDGGPSPGGDNRRRRSIRMLFSSSSFGRGAMFDFDYGFYDADDEREEVDLSYLQVDEDALPPKSRDILERITLQYLCDGVDSQTCDISTEPPRLDELLRAFDEEYYFVPVPFTLGDMSFDGKNDANEETFAAAKILSFAAMYRVPYEITTYLLHARDWGGSSFEEEAGALGKDGRLKAYALRFESGGWKSVSFPRGLALRVKRRFRPNTREKYLPLRLLPGRAAAAEEARTAVEGAAASLPPARRMSREEFLAEMDEAIGVRSQLAAAVERSLGDLKFFPPREDRDRFLRRAGTAAGSVRRRLSRVADGLMEQLKGLGKGGLLSYGFLNFAWYTLAIAVQWGMYTSPIQEDNVAALGASARKFGRVFLSAYVGSQVTKLPRLWAALALAPLGNRALRSAERRLRVGEATAFWIVTGLLIGTCLSIWAALIFGDAFLSSVGTFSM